MVIEVNPVTKICHNRVDCVEWGLAKANVDKDTFPKWIGL